MGRVCNRAIDKINQATTEHAAKVAVIDYLNKKVNPKLSDGDNLSRLKDKFFRVFEGTTQHRNALQDAYVQFLNVPKKLSKRDQKTVHRMNTANATQLGNLVLNFNYAKMRTGRTLKDNQKDLAAWAQVVDSHLVRNQSLAKQLFDLNGHLDILGHVHATKSENQRRAADGAFVALAAGVGSGPAAGVATGTL